MPRIDNVIDIKAPREKVFPYVADVASQPEWVKWAKDVDITSPGVSGLGQTDAMRMQVGPQRMNVEGLVTEYKDGQFITRRLTRGFNLTERLSVVPGPEGSKVSYIVEYKPPMGAIGRLIDFLVMVRLFDQLMKDSLTNLKERLETAR